MSRYPMTTLDGGETHLDGATVESFARGLRGGVVAPADDRYNEIRAVWNGMIDRRPGLIVRCRGAADVARAVDLARDHGLLVSVRGAGHNIAGNAVCDGGLMIDLALMKDVRVDPGARTARVGPGATLGDFDRETQAYGLATPVGINSTTGIAGLTLGGGFGWMTRAHGLTIDNLLSADVVTADGSLVVTSESEDEELFWGIRGGGGNFGVVTSFEFRLHELGPEVLAGLVVHPLENAPRVMRDYREAIADHPDETAVWAVLRKAPPLPFLPEEVHGTGILVLACYHGGSIEEGERVLAPLRAIGTPIADVVAPRPYVEWQTAFDPLLTPGARNYWKSHNFTEIGDEAIDTVLDYAGNLPSDLSEIFFGRVGGAANRVVPDATAYPHRDAEFVMNVHTRWEEPADDERCVAWAREFFDATAPFATGGTYVNFQPEDEEGKVDAAFGKNLERLSALKRRIDPDNLFRRNQNISPGSA